MKTQSEEVEELVEEEQQQEAEAEEEEDTVITGFNLELMIPFEFHHISIPSNFKSHSFDALKLLGLPASGFASVNFFTFLSPLSPPPTDSSTTAPIIQEERGC